MFRTGNNISENLKAMADRKCLNGHVTYLCEFLQRSCDGRFGRYLETARKDERKDRRFRTPAELRKK